VHRGVDVPSWGYSIKKLDPEKTALASGRDLPISLKEAREICKTIKGMMVKEAKELLKAVIEMKQPIPYRRYHGKVAHHRGLEKWKWPAGRYPVKAAKEILKVLENAENNAENKGLDVDRLKIIHAAAQKGPVIKKYTPRAFGRATPWFKKYTHVEIAVMEV